MKKIFISFSVALALFSCQKDNDGIGDLEQGDLVIKFEDYAGTKPLVLNDSTYLTSNSDTLKISTFNYYISNLNFYDNSGNLIYTEPESYHLIKASDAASHQFTVKKLPYKHYASISFMIGVDSARNNSGAQTGALDPANQMFWSWNTGYIMAKLEGTSPNSKDPNNYVTYHIGGYKGNNKVLKTKQYTLPTHAEVSATIVPEITIRANALEWFQSPTTINFATQHTVVTTGTSALMMADNYADMFSITQIKN